MTLLLLDNIDLRALEQIKEKVISEGNNILCLYYYTPTYLIESLTHDLGTDPLMMKNIS